MICERAAEKTTQLWICAEIRASKEQVRSEDCLFPVAGFLIAEPKLAVKGEAACAVPCTLDR